MCKFLFIIHMEQTQTNLISWFVTLLIHSQVGFQPILLLSLVAWMDTRGRHITCWNEEACFLTQLLFFREDRKPQISGSIGFKKIQVGELQSVITIKCSLDFLDPFID